ncbi:bifunctional (p)ppGpp synthetase/guanosine-3',5'-bis(diphosphate) 3'-pyrophosphohydrolase [Paralimibaculum aggregatum]|uniref:GTP pyrophosphokinase rsh n=1 Tax=Paralimibaculum aggregatum TaxID=3036245 RepID=A0ABQ6LKM7_9RHOB|nr:bifunctional (p)ppGpp synthetase/guanosine-3',5'-bis(diphosphate) 3'-pyrophosphohydrolase [Limibaculum sp. NKW23]GMG80961.1 bifunctional (p)ppGpp synthetase/guanosine-3',5'-bis(diphosphate) 3'-pyrophosphohydrolase [Limibaculum sp. NKW23]
MIRAYELVDRVRDYNPNTDVNLLLRAYVFGARAHGGQTRASGEPYFTGHPLEVAWILTEFRLDDATIVTALLHDTVEDTDATEDEITELFGAEIAGLVSGVTKLTKLELSSAESAQAENFRKLLLAMAKDVRVLLVKLADRLHNMRTIEHLKPEKKARIARETMEIYAPLAGRMGMQNMREQLEDLAFGALNPEGRTSILRRFIKLRRETGDLVPQISAEIAETLAAAGLKAEVQGREKRPYSVWRKMEEKQTAFSQLSDIYGFRVLCETEEDCYGALGAIHRRWRAVPERFKDYISGPKANGYRSIHTTVYGARAMRVEVQIRTREMHDVAESGVAAHWSYKNGEQVSNRFAVDPFSWLRDLVARLEKGDAPAEFLEHVKLDMFTDQVFCFTPQGDVVGLPRGATPIDFAYEIHTRVGDHCAGALVDGHRVPLWTRLRNGQQVEIITAEGQKPSRHWIDMVSTGRAKSAIRRALREQLRVEQIALGRDLAQQAFARAGREAGPKTLAAAATALTFPSVDGMLSAIARGEIGARHVVAAVYPDQPISQETEVSPQLPSMRLRGLRRGQAVRYCPDCMPIPGDRVMGLTRRGGVEVHAISCPHLADYEDALERWQDLGWDPEAAALATNLVRISLTLANQPGALGSACLLIGEQGANIDNLVITTRKPDFFLMSITLEVRDTKHLSGILTALRAQDYVSHADRTTSAEQAGGSMAKGQFPERAPALTGPART